MYWLSSLPLDSMDPSPEATWVQLQNATQRNQYSENCEFRFVLYFTVSGQPSLAASHSIAQPIISLFLIDFLR